MLLRHASRNRNERDIVVAAPEGRDAVSRGICRRRNDTMAVKGRSILDQLSTSGQTDPSPAYKVLRKTSSRTMLISLVGI